MELNLHKILLEVVNEYVDISYEDLVNDNHSMPIVYQCAFSDRLPSIFSNGMSREFAGSAGGNFYCTGLYSTFSLQSTINNSYTKAHLYGDAILKMGIKSYDRFFILDKDIAKSVYGNKWHIKDQVEFLLKDYPAILYKVKNGPYWREIIGNHHYTSENVYALCEAFGGMRRKCDPLLNKCDIRGFVFKGGNDGKVTIIRDFKAIIPLAYSMDHGKTWKKDLLNQETHENTAQQHDPIIFLGGDVDLYINPETYRFINGYMLVQRKEDKLFNLMNQEHEILSPMWFVKMSPMDDNHMAMAKLEDGEIIYVGEDGYYNNIDDEYPFATFDDV